MVCAHGKWCKARCRECKGSSFCKHDKRRNQCRECKGSSFCKHDKRRNQCRECKGSSICKHDKWRNRCMECKGSSICKHDKRRYRCRECKGSSICKHDKERYQCSECVSTDVMLQGNLFCHSCCSKILSYARRRARVHICAECDEMAVDRIEVVIRPLLLSSVSHPPSAQDDTLFGQTCDVVRRRRPDNLWLGNDRCIIFEVDENGGHPNYTVECDFGWMMDMVVALNELYSANGWNEGRVPYVHIVRMNPDEYDGGNVSLESRIAFVASRINEVFQMEVDPLACLLPTVEYMYYHSKCQPHIDFAKGIPDSIRVITAT